MSNIDLTQLVTAEDKSALSLATAKEEALASLVSWINGVTAEITGPVPEDEKLSWTAKEAAARAVLAGTETPEQSALITVEAQVGGEPAADLCASIVENADAYRAAISTLTGLRRKAVAEINDAADVSEVQAAFDFARASWAAVVSAQQS